VQMRVLLSVAATLSWWANPTNIAGEEAFRILTIEDAVNEAVQKNLGLLAERANLPVAEAGLATARLRPNPVLSGGANSLDWLGTGFDSTNGAGPPEYAVRIDMPFERAHKRDLRTDPADSVKGVAEARFADAVRRLRLDVTIAGIDVLEAKARLQLARENLQTLERLVQLNDRRLTSGAIPPLEVTRSRVAMLQYRSSVQAAQLALTQARLKLLPLLGRTPDQQPVDIDDVLGLPPASVGPDLADLQQIARSTRADLRARSLDQARTAADLRLQVAQGKVDYTLGAEYRRQQGVNGRGNLLGLFFTVPLPVFNRNQGEIARAEAEGTKGAKTLQGGETAVAGDVAATFEGS